MLDLVGLGYRPSAQMLVERAEGEVVDGLSVAPRIDRGRACGGG